MPMSNKEKQAAWYKRHGAEARAKKAAQQAKTRSHGGRDRTKDNEWWRAHPELRRAKDHRRRARETGAGGTYTPEEWASVLEQYGHRCRICAAEGPLTVDHALPLAEGGTNWVWNLQPLCGGCNSRKGPRVLSYL